MTPSSVSRLPASFISRARTGSVSDGDVCDASKRICNRGRDLVDVLAARPAGAEEAELQARFPG